MKGNDFCFSAISRAVLFGASETLSRFIEDGLIDDILVISGPRQSAVLTHTGEAWESFLGRRNVRSLFVETLRGNDEFLEFINDGTIGISSGSPYLFKKDILDLFKHRIINGHSARLPQQRGGGGYSWTIMQGNRVGYALWHLIDEGIDTGDIIALEEFAYPAGCQTPEDYQREKSQREYGLLRGLLADIRAGKPIPRMGQPNHLSVYMPRLHTDIHGFIDWRWDHQEIERFVRAFDRPHQGASTFLMGRQIRVRDATTVTFDGTFHPFQSGIIYRFFDQGVYVACKSGSLRCSLFTQSDNSPVPYNARLLGERLYTPSEYLERALRTRVEFLPTGPVVNDWKA